MHDGPAQARRVCLTAKKRATRARNQAQQCPVSQSNHPKIAATVIFSDKTDSRVDRSSVLEPFRANMANLEHLVCP